MPKKQTTTSSSQAEILGQIGQARLQQPAVAQIGLTLPESGQGKKVVLFGAGKIGLAVISNMLHDLRSFQAVDELVVINTRPDKVKGFLEDWRQTYGYKLFQSEHAPFTIIPSAQYEDISNADLIIVTVGLWADMALKQELSAIDPSGRFVQSIVNADLIEKISEAISQHAPKASVFMVTNQVDMMTEVMRQKLPNQSVFGVGGLVDTKRFQSILASILFEKEYLSNENPERIQAHIVGFHNKDMFLLHDSLLIDGEKPDWTDQKLSDCIKAAISATIVSGKEISSLKKDRSHPEIDTGVFILPAGVSTDIISAFVSKGKSLIGSFNTKLSDEASAHYGLAHKSVISVPVEISAGQVMLKQNYLVMSVEQTALKTAQLNLDKNMEDLSEIRSQRNQPVSKISRLSMSNT